MAVSSGAVLSLSPSLHALLSESGEWIGAACGVSPARAHIPRSAAAGCAGSRAAARIFTICSAMGPEATIPSRAVILPEARTITGLPVREDVGVDVGEDHRSIWSWRSAWRGDLDDVQAELPPVLLVQQCTVHRADGQKIRTRFDADHASVFEDLVVVGDGAGLRSVGRLLPGGMVVEGEAAGWGCCATSSGQRLTKRKACIIGRFMGTPFGLTRARLGRMHAGVGGDWDSFASVTVGGNGVDGGLRGRCATRGRGPALGNRGSDWGRARLRGRGVGRWRLRRAGGRRWEAWLRQLLRGHDVADNA